MSTKKLYAFDILTSQIFKIIKTFNNIHLYLKGEDSEILGFNEKQAIFYKLPQNSIGKKYYEFLPYAEVKATSINDQFVIKRQSTLLLIEKAGDYQCLSIKSPLKDSRNNSIGICGLSFYTLDKICLNDFFSVLNQLNICGNIHPTELIVNCLHLNTHYQQLSPREKECAKYLISHMSTKEIGKKLFISYKTVENHIDNMKHKLKCTQRSQLVNMLLDNNI